MMIVQLKSSSDIIMHPFLKPRTLILHDSEIDESPSSSVDSEYVAHLKSQCAIRYTALKTAENLIAAYQKENDSLKNENLHLRERLQAAQEKLAEAVSSKEVEALEKTVYKYSQRINELLEKEIEKDRRIGDLEQELRILQEREGRAREERQRREGREGREGRRQGEEKFHNFLRLPVPEDSFSSIASRSSIQKSSLLVLESQVKKKDAEILALLRRLRDVEEELKGQERGRKERLKTSDTVVHHSVCKNTYSSIEE